MFINWAGSRDLFFTLGIVSTQNNADITSRHLSLASFIDQYNDLAIHSSTCNQVVTFLNLG